MDIEIFPFRILGSDTTEKLLNEIESLDDKELEERYKEYCDLLSEMNY